MVKIEKLSEDCVAVLANGNSLFTGQLITMEQLQGVVVRSGTMTYSVDEEEVRIMTAAPAPAPAPASAPAPVTKPVAKKVATK